MKKIKFILGILIIFLLIQISLLTSQDIIDIGEVMGLPEETKIIGIGVEYQELEDNIFRISFVEENANLDVNGNVFTNIVPQETAGHPTYIDLNKDNVVKADFIVDKNGGTYTFGDKTINVSANSRVFFDIGRGIDIEFPDGVDLTNFQDLLGYMQEGYITEIKGKDILLPNGIFLDGKLKIEESGYFLKQGTANYKEMRLNVDDERNGVLIASFDADLSDYKGNWIKQSSDILKMQSAEKSFIDVEFLENHEILNTDDKDLLTVNIDSGDGLKFEKRTEKGLIPKVIHKSSENGDTLIYNDKMTLKVNKKRFLMPPPQPLQDSDLLGEYDNPADLLIDMHNGNLNEKNLGKFQSVAFEFESDSGKIGDKLIRINSYRQFAILDKNDNEIVTYNKYGLPVSALIEDNELQTIEQLREKYPELEFEVPTYFSFSGYYNQNVINEKNLPPYMIYLTDNFLKENLDSINDLTKIEFSDVNMHMERLTMSIGMKYVDPVSVLPQRYGEKFGIRDITTSLQLLTHEYEHGQDHVIVEKELEILRKDSEINFLVNKLGDSLYLCPEEEKKLKEFEQSDKFFEELKKPYYKTKWFEFQKDISKCYSDKNDVLNEIYKIYYEKSSKEKKTLRQKYNEIATDIIATLSKTKIGDKSRELLEDMRKDVLDNIDNLMRKNKNMDVIDYALKENKEFKRLYGNREEILKKKERLYQVYYWVFDDIVQVKDDFSNDIEQVDQFISTIRSLKNIKAVEEDGKVYALTSFLKEFDGKYNKKIEDTFRAVSGVPYSFSLHNCNKDSDNPADANYAELSATYKEQSKEKRRMLVQSANPLISEMSKRLEQMRFDSGKDKNGEEYKYVMGEECEKSDCSDKLCIEYKLLCCEDNPGSPNC